MDPASRPSLAPLADLPLEELPQANTATERPAAAARAPAGSASRPAALLASKDPEQSGLNFVDPEMFLAAGEKPSAIPVGAAVAARPPETNETLELEDPVVDDLLTSLAALAPTPVPAPARAPTPSAVRLTPAAPIGKADAARIMARVPIARTASLDPVATRLAATKLAAATAARSAVKPTAAPLPAPALTPSVHGAAAPKPAPVPRQQAPSTVAPSPSAPPASPAPLKTDAATLASWAQARAAATNVPRVSAAPPIPTVTPSAGTPGSEANGAGAAPTVARAAPVPEATAQPPPAPTAAPMDRDFIARNQVVERYLSGRLPLKGATDFERFCHQNPQILDEIGLPERVNAGLRLLEASGKPEPWQEKPRPLWQKPQVPAALA
ncbi:MAG: hypothetical protein JO361_08325, partial [Gammaproteobacteria bacterium]|nr:hypothetical protein [Gammaproteobacteria bacterium]